MSTATITSAQMVASPANGPERDVSAQGWATYGALSADARSMVSKRAMAKPPSTALIWLPENVKFGSR